MAEVAEYEVMYSHHVMQKRKVWHDGKLKFSSGNQRLVLEDDEGRLVDDHWLPVGGTVTEGQTLRLTRSIVEVAALLRTYAGAERTEGAAQAAAETRRSPPRKIVRHLVAPPSNAAQVSLSDIIAEVDAVNRRKRNPFLVSPSAKRPVAVRSLALAPPAKLGRTTEPFDDGPSSESTAALTASTLLATSPPAEEVVKPTPPDSAVLHLPTPPPGPAPTGEQSPVRELELVDEIMESWDVSGPLQSGTEPVLVQPLPVEPEPMGMSPPVAEVAEEAAPMPQSTLACARLSHVSDSQVNDSDIDRFFATQYEAATEPERGLSLDDDDLTMELSMDATATGAASVESDGDSADVEIVSSRAVPPPAKGAVQIPLGLPVRGPWTAEAYMLYKWRPPQQVQVKVEAED